MNGRLLKRQHNAVDGRADRGLGQVDLGRAERCAGLLHRRPSAGIVRRRARRRRLRRVPIGVALAAQLLDLAAQLLVRERWLFTIPGQVKCALYYYDEQFSAIRPHTRGITGNHLGSVEEFHR